MQNFCDNKNIVEVTLPAGMKKLALGHLFVVIILKALSYQVA